MLAIESPSKSFKCGRAMKHCGSIWVLGMITMLSACSDDIGKQSTALVEKAPSQLASGKTDPATGLIVADGFATVKKNCTVCHSPQLITQNKASREGWLDTIRWMQATQNLRQFDPRTEDIILTYLAKNYAPLKIGRRPLLRIVQWYRLTPAR